MAAADTGYQHSDNASEEDAVEGSSSADGSDGRFEFGDITEVHKIAADQGAQRSRNIGKWGGVLAREKKRNNRRCYDRSESG